MQNNQEVEFVMPDNLPELADLCSKLWDRVADTTDKKERKALVGEYNMFAAEYNKLCKRDDMTIITAKTKVMKSAEEDTVSLSKTGRVVTKTAFVPEGMTGNTLANTTAKAKSKRTKIETIVPAAVKKAAASTKPAAAGEPKEGSIIHQILEHHKAGKSNKEICELGFNKSTVNRQVNEYKKRKKANEQSK